MDVPEFFMSKGRSARSRGLPCRPPAHLTSQQREFWISGWWKQHSTKELAQKAAPQERAP